MIAFIDAHRAVHEVEPICKVLPIAPPTYRAHAAWTADWSRVDRQTDADIEAAMRNDADAAPLADEAWFDTACIVEPTAKQAISIRLAVSTAL